jgi:hypothetical protein
LAYFAASTDVPLSAACPLLQSMTTSAAMIEKMEFVGLN